MNEIKSSRSRSVEEKRTLNQFADTLRSLRGSKGYSQEEIAHLAGFSRSYYAELETGKRNISLINISKILRVLEVSPNDLIPLPLKEEEK